MLSSDRGRRWRAGSGRYVMLKVVHEENESQQHVPAGVGGSLLDELAVTAHGRCSLRRCWLRSPPTSRPMRERSTRTDTGWWSATASTTRGRSRPRPGRSRCVSRGSTTSASTRPPGSASGSPRRSCPRGRGSPRAWPRCSRCSICTACPAGTSCRAGAVPRLDRWFVRGDRHPPHGAVARRGERVRQAVAG